MTNNSNVRFGSESMQLKPEGEPQPLDKVLGPTENVGSCADEDRFGKGEVSITMTGEEWFALLCRTVGKALSLEGARAYNRATDKMQKQLLAASAEYRVALAAKA